VHWQGCTCFLTSWKGCTNTKKVDNYWYIAHRHFLSSNANLSSLICQKHLTFLDLSKAFDMVNHNILFDKFYHNFGIRGIPLQLFRSYLSNRKQFVKLENVQSGLVDISNGVPQGSVLGPLCFACTLMIYLNPLHFILYYMLMIFIFVS